MNIDGVNTLACLSRIDRSEAKASKLYPLPHSTFPPTPKTLLSLASLMSTVRFFSVCGQGSHSRHDPILQTIQVHRAFLEERQPSRERGILPKRRRPTEA